MIYAAFVCEPFLKLLLSGMKEGGFICALLLRWYASAYLGLSFFYYQNQARLLTSIGSENIRNKLFSSFQFGLQSMISFIIGVDKQRSISVDKFVFLVLLCSEKHPCFLGKIQCHQLMPLLQVDTAN